MSEVKYTTGPWMWDSDEVKGDPFGRVRFQVVARGKTIAKTYYSSYEGGITNAKEDTILMAAAPELLESLINLRWAASERDNKNRIRQFDEFMDEAARVIAKATPASLSGMSAKPASASEPAKCPLHCAQPRQHTMSRVMFSGVGSSGVSASEPTRLAKVSEVFKDGPDDVDYCGQGGASASASGASEELPQFEDSRVQVAYEILCSDDVPPKGEHWEGFAARRIAAALSKPAGQGDGRAVARREALIEKTFQRVFAGYNTPRDRYPDDFSYSVFQGKCLSDAMSLLQRVTGRASWANDNCPAPADVERVDDGAERLDTVMNMAAGMLPEGYEVRVCVERHAGWVELLDEEAENVAPTFDGDHTLTEQVVICVRKAIADAARQPSTDAEGGANG